MLQSFDSLAISLSDLHNYFDSSTKLFSGPAKCLDISAKPFFTLYYIHCNIFSIENRSWILDCKTEMQLLLDFSFFIVYKERKFV